MLPRHCAPRFRQRDHFALRHVRACAGMPNPRTLKAVISDYNAGVDDEVIPIYHEILTEGALQQCAIFVYFPKQGFTVLRELEHTPSRLSCCDSSSPKQSIWKANIKLLESMIKRLVIAPAKRTGCVTGHRRTGISCTLAGVVALTPLGEFLHPNFLAALMTSTGMAKE